MKERPIIFSAPMVRAILEDRKTQSRRVFNQHRPDRSPYGGPGERLWVKEAWHAASACDAKRPGELETGAPLWYAADGAPRTVTADTMGKKRSVLFMPRWAARITLEITQVRTEPLQDIGVADARAEGCDAGGDPVENYRRLWNSINAARGFGWDENPLVWVVQFRRTP